MMERGNIVITFITGLLSRSGNWLFELFGAVAAAMVMVALAGSFTFTPVTSPGIRNDARFWRSRKRRSGTWSI